MTDEGSGRLPERDECEHLGHRDSFEEQRGAGAQTLPHDRDSRRSRETKPTTFETLTGLSFLVTHQFTDFMGTPDIICDAFTSLDCYNDNRNGSFLCTWNKKVAACKRSPKRKENG